MRLKEKLLRKDCPACGEEITLGASSLNKKINCPRCRQTIIIPDGGLAAVPAKKAPAKKAVAKEKLSERPVPVEETPVVREEPRIFIQNLLAEEEEEKPVPVAKAPAVKLFVEEPPAPESTATSPSKKRDVVYCLCNGVLKRRADGAFCSPAPGGVCCIYASQPGS